MPFNPGTLGSAVTSATVAPSMNITLGGVFNLSLTPGAVGAASTGTLTVSNTGLGLQTNDFIRVSLQGTQTAGIFIADAWVSGTDQLAVTFGNVTAASATPVSGNYDVLVMRPSTTIAQINPAIQP